MHLLLKRIFYKKQAKFHIFQKNKLTYTIHYKNLNKIRVFFIIIKIDILLTTLKLQNKPLFINFFYENK